MLLTAPAGNGKTTLLAQAYHELRQRELRTGWLTLDSSDASAEEFIPYLTRSLLDAGAVRDDVAAAAQELLACRSARAALAALLSGATATGCEAVLFLDDVHCLTGPTSIWLLRTILEDSTNNLRFIIAGRWLPGIQVAKLQLNGAVEIVCAPQLNFTLLESAAWLGLDPTDDVLKGLHRSTRGWPVALELCAASANSGGHPDARGLPASSVPRVADYLTEQVLPPLAPSLTEFLLITSVPARICASLANRLCGRSDSHGVLQQLLRDGLFITEEEERRGWYRYHEFFCDFLRSQLAQHPTLDPLTIHGRAAEWFLQAGQFEDALKHGLEAGAWQLVIAILEKEGGWRIALRYGGDVLHGIEQMPDDAMHSSLLARLTLVYLLLHFGQPDRARERFEELRVESADFTQWRGETLASNVRAECHALEAIIIVDEERPLSVSFVERIKQETCALGVRGQFVRTVTHSGLAIYANYDAGNYRQCIRLAEEGFTALKDIDANFGLGYLHIYLGMSQFALGRLHLAQTAYQNALELAATHFPHESQRIEALACMAETQYYADDLQSARRNIDAALAGLKNQPAVDGPVFQVTYLTAAALYARAHDLDSALSLLMEARAVALYLQRWQRLANIDIRRVEELTRAGYVDDAREITQQEGFRHALTKAPESPGIPLLAMQASLALARLELASSNAAAANRRLTALQARCEHYQHEVLKLKCLTLLVACQFVLGNRAESMQGARRLCSRIIPLGLRRVVADERSFVQPAFEYALDGGERSGSAAHVNSHLVWHDWLRADTNALLQADTAQSPTSVASTGAQPGVLSPRQREVLELLAAGLSGKEIASRLSLSESTVKSYRKSLYARLRAGRRSQALANARRMALLP